MMGRVLPLIEKPVLRNMHWIVAIADRMGL
jgi:hypothetical protein